MNKQETLKNVKQTRQILKECVENDMLDDVVSWRLQRALQIAEEAVIRIPAQNELFQGIKLSN